MGFVNTAYQQLMSWISVLWDCSWVELPSGEFPLGEGGALGGWRPLALGHTLGVTKHVHMVTPVGWGGSAEGQTEQVGRSEPPSRGRVLHTGGALGVCPHHPSSPQAPLGSHSGPQSPGCSFSECAVRWSTAVSQRKELTLTWCVPQFCVSLAF